MNNLDRNEKGGASGDVKTELSEAAGKYGAGRMRLFFFFLALVLLASWFMPAGAAHANIEISSIEELQKIGNHPNYPLDGDYYLTQDIDASETEGWNDGAGFEPIGPDFDTLFSGTFDGKGRVIEGLFINRPEDDYVGLFGWVRKGGSVENLGLEGGSVTGGERYVGGLAGYNSGTVSDCYATGAVSGESYVGGLVGRNGFYEATVSDCYATGAVSGEWEIGGLVGRNNGTVSGCYATGAVSGYRRVGGLGGRNSGTLSQCYATGAVSGDNFAGGLVGRDEGWVFASFWEKDANGLLSGDSGKGLTSARMRERGVFQKAGWGGTAWVMAEGERPRLAWEGTGAQAIPEPEPLPLAGSGTEQDPYLVGTPEEFALLSRHAHALTAHIALVSDVDCEGVELRPIGKLGPFTGVFDGRGRSFGTPRQGACWRFWVCGRGRRNPELGR